MQGKVFRIEKNKNYTVISNYHLKDKNLSFKAKGLLSMLLSLPDDWDYSINGLVAISKEEIRAVKSTLKELKDNGYLKIIKTSPTKNKNYFTYEYVIYEVPQDTIHEESQLVDIQSVEIQNVPLQNVQIQDDIQLNTNKLSTKELNTEELNTKDNIYSSDFNDFYNLYPRKQSKHNALRAYIRARKNKIDKNTIIEGLKRYIEYIKTYKKEKEFIKLPATWLNQECWDDEYDNKEYSANDTDVSKLINMIKEV